MSDRRQVLQEAENALWTVRRYAGHDTGCRALNEGGDQTAGPVCSCGWVGVNDAARSALALIRASLAEGDPVHPSAVTADAIAKTILDSITNHRDLRLHLDITDENLLIGLAHGWREQISAALNAKEQA